MLPQLLKRSLYGRRINLCLLFLLGFLDAVKIAPQSEYLANAIDARHREISSRSDAAVARA
jgi:hypothetical protein